MVSAYCALSSEVGRLVVLLAEILRYLVDLRLTISAGGMS